jgi:sugar/nucleoside kinase (ribokinase family)
MKKQPDIIFVGHVCIDHNVVEGTTYVDWGSPAIYMTKYFQTVFAMQPTIISRYGSDFTKYVDDISLCPKVPDIATTLIYENIVKEGKRTQYCHTDNAELSAPITTDAKVLLKSANILFVTPLMPTYTPQYIMELMANVPDDCLKVLLPQGYLRHIGDNGLVEPREFEEARDILPYFDLVVLSDEDHPQANTRVHEWKHFSPHTQFVITQNAQGANIIQEDSSIHIPTIPIPEKLIVDSVGCGDIFSAATAYHLHATNDISFAVQQGHEAARKKLLTPKASGV